MSLHHTARLIEQIAEMQVEEFLLTGGEPLARPDLAEVIGMLQANRVRWSLNTAQMPDLRTQAAIEKWPPGFAAVSLDGPKKVHDGFRGVPGTFHKAMQSIGYFSDMGVSVAAGTTVTSRNFRHLSDTFGIVLGSGATTWGIHLPVPEGRASVRKALFLSRSRIKWLLDFVASKRSYFPITMADEIGYCGFWEPLLRDEPFFCGAGRAGCVVLPGGEVVPCTTLDRTTSAGNVMEHSLRDIWETGFEDLRAWTPKDKCNACSYVSACAGGCWLQRRHGAECFRDVWHMPQALKTAVGIAICFGITSSGAAALAQESVQHQELIPPSPAAPPSVTQYSDMEMLQCAIIRWYASQLLKPSQQLKQPASLRSKGDVLKIENGNEDVIKAVNKASSLTLPNGKVIDDPFVLSEKPDGLEIGHKAGIIFVKFTDLPAEMQKKVVAEPLRLDGTKGVRTTEDVIEDIRKKLPDDPGAQYFVAFAKGERPKTIEDRGKAIINAFNTEQRSLCLVGLAWRDVTEWCLVNTRPEARTEAERKALREVIAKIGETSGAWRVEIFENKLDPFLRQPVQSRQFFAGKAGPRTLAAYQQIIEINLSNKIWQGGKDITRQFLAEHPFAESLAFDFTVGEGANIKCIRAGQVMDVDRNFTFRAFDILVVPEQGKEKPATLELSFGRRVLKAVLPSETELAYGDVLRIVHEQNNKVFEDADVGLSSTFPGSPLALPEVLKRMEYWRNSKESNAKEIRQAEFQYHSVIRRLFDLYLF